MLRTFEARIKLPNGSYQKITVQADDSTKAKAMLEAQYGKGNVSSVFQK